MWEYRLYDMILTCINIYIYMHYINVYIYIYVIIFLNGGRNDLFILMPCAN